MQMVNDNHFVNGWLQLAPILKADLRDHSIQEGRIAYCPDGDNGRPCFMGCLGGTWIPISLGFVGPKASDTFTVNPDSRAEDAITQTVPPEPAGTSRRGRKDS